MVAVWLAVITIYTTCDDLTMEKQRLLRLLVLGSLLLGGCATFMHAESMPGATPNLPELPKLNQEQSIRDDIARSEEAIALSARDMAEIATQCADCATMLSEVSRDAQTRLTVSGGMWEPWEGQQSGQFLPHPADVGDAPTTPKGLVGYMMGSAVAQLNGIVTYGSPDASTLSSLLAGRIASALTLAKLYDVDVNEAVENLPKEALATSVSPTEISQSGVEANEMHRAQSDVEDSIGEKALFEYDCLTTALGRSSLVRQHSDIETTLRMSLIERSQKLVEAVQSDSRSIRCMPSTSDSGEFMTQLVGTDLTLIESPDSRLRSLAREFLIADVRTWNRVGEVPKVTPGMTEG